MLNLFKRSKKANLTSDKTAKQSDSIENYQEDLLAESISMPMYRVSSCQSTGVERSHNEDTIFIFNSTFLGYETPISVGLFIVADGMGGHQHGEEASQMAARGAGQMLLEKLLPNIFSEQHTYSENELKKLVKESVKHAQDIVLNQVAGGGTTLTFVLAVNDQLISAHVGDSRLYLVEKGGNIRLKTRDHSLVNRLVELGEISSSEADQHPQRNVLYRALGQSDALEADILQFSLESGEGFLICSDGLWGVLDDQVIEEKIKSVDDFDLITAELVRAANDAGGPDNISVILVEKIA